MLSCFKPTMRMSKQMRDYCNNSIAKSMERLVSTIHLERSKYIVNPYQLHWSPYQSYVFLSISVIGFMFYKTLK